MKSDWKPTHEIVLKPHSDGPHHRWSVMVHDDKAFTEAAWQGSGEAEWHLDANGAFQYHKELEPGDLHIEPLDER